MTNDQAISLSPGESRFGPRVEASAFYYCNYKLLPLIFHIGIVKAASTFIEIREFSRPLKTQITVKKLSEENPASDVVLQHKGPLAKTQNSKLVG